MKVTERDKVCSKVLLDVLSAARHDLKGSEVIAVARVMDWAADIKRRIEDDLKAPIVETQKEPPKEAPVEKEEEPKKTRKVKKDVRSE